MRLKYYGLISVCLLFLLVSCVSRVENKKVFITNVLNDSEMIITRFSGENNQIPILVITNLEIDQLKVEFYNESENMQLTSELQKVEKDQYEFSNAYVFSKYEYDWDEVGRLEEQIVAEKDMKIQSDLTSQQDKLLNVSESRKKEVTKLLEDYNVYFLVASLDFNTLSYDKQYTGIRISNGDDVVLDKPMTLTLNPALDSSEISPRSLSLLHYEIAFGYDLSFELGIPIRIEEDIKMNSFSIDSKALEATELYVRVTRDGVEQENIYKKSELSMLNLDLKTGDSVVFIPTIESKVTSELPFYYGCFEVAITYSGANGDKEFRSNSGVISTLTDPYVYYGYLEEGLTNDGYFMFQNKYRSSSNWYEITEEY